MTSTTYCEHDGLAMPTCSHCELLRALLRDVRAYTAKIEGGYAPMRASHSYMPDFPPEARDLYERLNAEIGPPA